MFSLIRSSLLASAVVAMAAAQEDTPFLKTAMDVFARATTNSEVLSLNLSGLIILLVLKVAVVAFSLMSGGATARSAASTYSEADLTGGMCFILYTSGDEAKLNCVARAACESTENAADFLTAAKLWYKMHNIIKAVPFSEKYNKVIDVVEAANNHGKAGGECSQFGW